MKLSERAHRDWICFCLFFVLWFQGLLPNSVLHLIIIHNAWAEDIYFIDTCSCQTLPCLELQAPTAYHSILCRLPVRFGPGTCRNSSSGSWVLGPVNVFPVSKGGMDKSVLDSGCTFWTLSIIELGNIVSFFGWHKFKWACWRMLKLI